MTIEECYTRMNADYTDVLRRLVSAERVRRCLTRLPDDPSFSNLDSALADHQAEDAFRAAHSIKGISANLGLTNLYESSSALEDALRDGKISNESTTLVKQVKKDYQTVKQYIQALT